MLLALVVLTGFSSCKEEEEAKRPSFMSYSLAGGLCSGEFRIDDDGDDATLEFLASIFPATDDNPEVIFISFSDPESGQYVNFQIPAEETGSPIVITRDSEFFGMSIQHDADQCSLLHGVPDSNAGVNVHVKKFKRGSHSFGSFLVDELEVSVTGKMTHTTQSGEVVEYLVDGSFYYGGFL